ncbi:hypothetical protein SAMN06269173_10151 [Hymenobacter mucosus]|uniref:DUF6311 domain-containing protein n=2 Tax=Hymenobacteraceae TaxID=1853232 RepID=A0A238V5C4_9BACT|nr:hypothetical protein SAMN06269173_10151 [Hymenobacter mucosus]
MQVRNQRSRHWLTLVVVLAVGLLGSALFAPIVEHPGGYLFSSIDDGIKNYYTAAWYVQHDTAWWFSGMNYPFGEHVVFTDNQPPLAYVLGVFHRQGVALDVVAVFNVLMLLAQLLSVPPLLALLRRCRLPAWYAALATGLIVLLAPQLERMLGHYALSYSCVIPLLWYALVRATETTTRRPGLWYAAYATLTTVFGFLHPYYLAISALLLLAHSAVAWWQRPKALRGRPSVGFWLRVLATVAVPMVLFQASLALTDPFAADRPTNPYGFFAYSSSVWSVFFPVETPVREAWQRVFHTPDPSWEGQAYVGLVATLITLATLVRVGQRLRRRQWRRLRWPALPPVLRVSLWAGLLILLFSMGWPFRWGLEGLLNFLGPIRQFRSIGRFAWIFYYFYSVYAAYALYQGFRWLRQRGRKEVATGVLSACLLLWAVEGVFNTAHKSYRILHPERGRGRTLSATSTTYPQRLRQAGRQAQEFQALVPLPFYLLGSEVFSIGHGDKSSYESMRASLEMGMPLAATMLSRTPLYQAQATGQLLSHPAIDKPVLAHYPDQRPLLVLVAAGEELDSTEASLLARAHIFYRDSTVWLAELPISQLENRPALTASFRQQRAQLIARPGYWASASAPQIVHLGFDTPAQEPSFSGADKLPAFQGGSAQGLRKNGFFLLNQPQQQAGWYEASIWAYARTTDLPTLHGSLLSATGAVLDSAQAHTKYSPDILGDWVRLTVRLRVRQPGQRLRFWMRGRKVWFDEFELRPAAVTSWRQPTPSAPLVRNNYPLIAPPFPAELPKDRRK